MENRELIYEMARRLNMVIEVHKKGEYIGRFRFVNNKLHKLNENKQHNNNQEKEVRELRKD